MAVVEGAEPKGKGSCGELSHLPCTVIILKNAEPYLSREWLNFFKKNITHVGPIVHVLGTCSQWYGRWHWTSLSRPRHAMQTTNA